MKKSSRTAAQQRNSFKGNYFHSVTTALLFCCSVALLFCCSAASAEKVYIDITSPGMRKLPVAVQNFTGGKELSDIVKDDLNFTGLFDCIDDAAQIERPDQPFNPNSWKGLGVELVVKGRVVTGKGLTIVISAYDVSSAAEILRKEYSGSADLSRPLAHSIANDVYKTLTGQQGIFRTKIAFIKNSEIHLMDWDGHRAYGLGIKGGILLSPRWSPDGTKLLYSAERNRSWDIYALDMNTLKEKNLVRLSGLNMSGNFFPNNREFVFSSSKDGKSNIHVGDISNMKGWKLVSSPWIDVSPSVSPYGNNVAFVSNRSGSPQIYIANKDGNGVRRLTFEGSYNTSPAWSSKGDRIAFARMIGGKNQIFVIKPDGSGLTQLTDRGNNEEPSFSPDGRYITFTSDRDGSKGIYLMRVTGEDQKRITPKGIKATGPNWSP